MRFIILALLLTFSSFAFSQKVVKLDVPKNPSKAAYYIGSTIIFKLDNDEKSNTIWYQERITDLDSDKGFIYFDSWKIHVSDIIELKNPNGYRLLRTAGTMLKGFGLGLIGFSTLGRLSKCDNCNEALIFGAGTTLVGWILEKLSGVKKYKIGKKNKLRVLDLTPKPEKV